MCLLTVPCLPCWALAGLDVVQRSSTDEIIFPTQLQTQNARLTDDDRLLTSCLFQLMSRIEFLTVSEDGFSIGLADALALINEDEVLLLFLF